MLDKRVLESYSRGSNPDLQLQERAMAAELTDHVGSEKHDVAGNRSQQQFAQWQSAKTLIRSFVMLSIEAPRFKCLEGE